MIEKIQIFEFHLHDNARFPHSVPKNTQIRSVSFSQIFEVKDKIFQAIERKRVSTPLNNLWSLPILLFL